MNDVIDDIIKCRFPKLECHPCIVGIWSILDNTGRQSQRGFIKLINGTYKGGRIYVAVVGENITAERGTWGWKVMVAGKLYFNSFNRGAF